MSLYTIQPYAVIVGSHLPNFMNIIDIIVVPMNIFHYVEVVLVTAVLIRTLLGCQVINMHGGVSGSSCYMYAKVTRTTSTK